MEWFRGKKKEIVELWVLGQVNLALMVRAAAEV